MFKRTCLIFLIVCTASYAETKKASDKASDASIRELLGVTNARRVLDGVMAQLDGVMKAGIEQQLKGETLTPQQEKMIATMQTKMVAIIKEELSWEKLEPMYFSVYRESFTQEEIEGMLAFYKTPAGKAVINKLPVVMQRTMTEMQTMMRPMIQRIGELEKETIQEIKAEAAK